MDELRERLETLYANGDIDSVDAVLALFEPVGYYANPCDHGVPEQYGRTKRFCMEHATPMYVLTRENTDG